MTPALSTNRRDSTKLMKSSPAGSPNMRKRAFLKERAKSPGEDLDEVLKVKRIRMTDKVRQTIQHQARPVRLDQYL